MTEMTLKQFGLRLDEYVAAAGLHRFSVILHGGEPLLYSPDGLVRLAAQLRGIVKSSCNLEFSMQTNGVLLTDQALDALRCAGIEVSLSLDGPRNIHDKHRLSHRGASTFDDTMAALGRLTTHGRDIFTGVIAVIDFSTSPRELLNFFASLDIPRLDLLLPDATHAAPPERRTSDQASLGHWLEEAFALWLREYPALPIRWFDAVLASRLGIPSPTDVMGLGRVTLLVIETDGSYTDHDVFKITGPYAGHLGLSVFDSAISEVAKHPTIRQHGYLLTFDGLAKECKTCPVVDSCGGGCVMHRAHPERGLDAPTVYCSEMFGLLSAASRVLRESLGGGSIASPEKFTGRNQDLVERCRGWKDRTEQQADERAVQLRIERGTTSAAGILLLPPDGSHPNLFSAHSEIDVLHFWLTTIRVQSSDSRLIEPFRDTIRVLASDSEEVRHAISSLSVVEACLRMLDPALPTAIASLISDVILVETLLPEESGIFSFSDNTVPNVLYVAAYSGGSPIAPDDLGDSIYHEFLHQLLYHYERDGEALLFDRVYPRFPAPWRSGLREAGAFLHGAFVFSGLAQYWNALASAETLGLDRMKAGRNASRARRQATHGIICLREFALLTPRGLQVVESLAAELKVGEERMQAPGLLV